ncbi:MAG: MHYT domain-containing protein, partial [Massilia sp.]
MRGVYDPWIVLLSIVVAVAASYASLYVLVRARRGGLRLLGSATTLGCGVWSMHFVGMLAFSLPIPLSYEWGATVLSCLVAVGGAALALLALERLGEGRAGVGAAALLLGAGISGMHYLGMAAIPLRPGIVFQPGLTALSVLIAVLASGAALTLALRLRANALALWPRRRRKLTAALAMGAAIAGMHYVGMAAARFAPDSVCSGTAGSLDSNLLAMAVGTLALIGLALAMAVARYKQATPTIGATLALLVVACVLPAVLLVAGAIYFQYERERDQMLRDAVATARVLSIAVERDLASVESALQALATSPYVAADDLAALHRQALLMMPSLNAANIYVTDNGGRQLLNTLRPYGALMPPTGNPAQVQAVFSSGRAQVSGLYIGALSRRPTVALGVPVRIGGRVKYYLGASMSTDRLNALLRSQRLPSSWIVAVHDRAGVIMARTHESARFLGQPASPDLQRALGREPEGTLEGVTREGVRVMAAFTQSVDSGWVVSIGIPKRELLAGMRRSLWIGAVISAVSLGFGLLMATLLGRRISGALHALVGPARDLSRAERFVAPPATVVEIDLLAEALEKTSQVLFRTQYQAQHDDLTGLANRTLLFEIARQQVELCDRRRVEMALLFVDLDGFK